MESVTRCGGKDMDLCSGTEWVLPRDDSNQIWCDLDLARLEVPSKTTLTLDDVAGWTISCSFLISASAYLSFHFQVNSKAWTTP